VPTHKRLGGKTFGKVGPDRDCGLVQSAFVNDHTHSDDEQSGGVESLLCDRGSFPRCHQDQPKRSWIGPRGYTGSAGFSREGRPLASPSYARRH